MTNVTVSTTTTKIMKFMQLSLKRLIEISAWLGMKKVQELSFFKFGPLDYVHRNSRMTLCYRNLLLFTVKGSYTCSMTFNQMFRTIIIAYMKKSVLLTLEGCCAWSHVGLPSAVVPLIKALMLRDFFLSIRTNYVYISIRTD